MSDRELALEAVRKMPDQSSLDEIVEELGLLADLRGRLAEADQNNGLVSHDEAVARVEAWKTRVGR